jgi:integrase
MALNALAVRKLKTPGRYLDGGGLLLHVVSASRRSWIYRYIDTNGRERWLGLGSAATVSLAEAREAAEKAQKLRGQGIDPVDHKRAAKQAAKVEAAKQVSFEAATEAFVTTRASGWKQPRHAQQVRGSLARHAFPIIGAMPVGEIDANAVLRVLQPLWHAKTETASRIRSRIEAVLDFASVRGWRSGANPAIWRGNLKLVLPSKRAVRKVEHFAALDWREAPAFMAKLRQRTGMGAAALRFAIMTAARSSEVRGARWNEIDLENATWTIPAARMKAAREHRVPLSPPALAILREQEKLQDGSRLVFLGQRHGTPMSDMTLSAVLKRMDRGEITVHGFRSCFRDWCAEATDHPAYVAEMALAHSAGSAVEKAYRRGDLFDKRRQLMDEWAAYLARPPAEIVPLRPGAQKASRRAGSSAPVLDSAPGPEGA